MASDASIKRVEELGVYSSHLQGFCDSMVKNGTGFVNVMAQKFQILSQSIKEAEEIVKMLRQADLEAENQLAFRKEGSDLAMLQQQYNKAHDKLVTANHLLSELRSKVNVARGAVMVMSENTRSFQFETNQKIESGRQTLKKAADQLMQYKESQKQMK